MATLYEILVVPFSGERVEMLTHVLPESDQEFVLKIWRALKQFSSEIAVEDKRMQHRSRSRQSQKSPKPESNVVVLRVSSTENYMDGLCLVIRQDTDLKKQRGQATIEGLGVPMTHATLCERIQKLCGGEAIPFRENETVYFYFSRAQLQRIVA